MNVKQSTRKMVMYLIIVIGLSAIAYGSMVASGGRDNTGPLGFLLR